MTSADRVVCLVVPNVLHHLTTLGEISPEPSSFDMEVEIRGELPGVILRVADVTSAVIGFHKDPDSTLSLVLSEPVFTDNVAPEVRAAWFRHMLPMVANHAKKNDFAQIRFLDWECQFDAEPWIAQELELAAFSALASIVGWKTTAEACLIKTSTTLTVRLSTADLHTLSGSLPDELTPTATWTSKASQIQQRYQQIAEALDQILENTDDLSGLPAPNAIELMQKWGSQECTLLVAEDATGVVGLCAFAFKPSLDGDPGPSGQIEYLGVRKDMKRQGIATQMLSCLCCGISKDSDQKVDLTAFADETNRPANAFYLRLGFEPIYRGKLWSRVLKTADLSLK